MISNILFDLDDTLLDFKRTEKVALTDTLNELGVPPKDETVSLYSGINLSLWKRLERGEITVDVLRVMRFEMLFSALGLDICAQRATDIYGKNLALGAFLVDGAVDVLEKLFGKYSRYVASNGIPEVQRSRIAKSNIAPYFRDIFISAEIGFAKPDICFFEHCFARMDNFSKEETVIIGDSLSSDILGGITAGIKTVWLANPVAASGDVTPDARISSLYELPELLCKM